MSEVNVIIVALIVLISVIIGYALALGINRDRNE
jgi:hypothetical protein